MRSSHLLAFLISTSLAHAQTYSYQSGDHVFVAKLAPDTSQPLKVASGTDGSLSPDGTQVAYTQSDAQGDRRIAVADVATGKSRLVSGIPGKNAFMPVWSTDGKQILFSQFLETDWCLAQVDAAGGNYRVVVEPSQRQVAAFAPLPDGKTWLCHDLESFFTVKINADAAPIISDITKDPTVGGLSMPARISVAPDGRSALFQKYVDEDMGPNDDYPPLAVFQINLGNGKIQRITQKGLHAESPAWLPNGEDFLFSLFDTKSSESTIASLSINEPSSPKIIQKVGANPSVSSAK